MQLVQPATQQQGITRKSAEAQLAEVRDDLSRFLANSPHQIPQGLSTTVTVGAAAIAGAFDGWLGDRAKIGPVPIMGVVGGIALAGSLVVKDANLAELGQAAARGILAPLAYVESRDRVDAYMHEALAKRNAEQARQA